MITNENNNEKNKGKLARFWRFLVEKPVLPLLFLAFVSSFSIVLMKFLYFFSGGSIALFAFFTLIVTFYSTFGVILGPFVARDLVKRKVCDLWSLFLVAYVWISLSFMYETKLVTHVCGPEFVSNHWLVFSPLVSLLPFGALCIWSSYRFFLHKRQASLGRFAMTIALSVLLCGVAVLFFAPSLLRGYLPESVFIDQKFFLIGILLFLVCGVIFSIRNGYIAVSRIVGVFLCVGCFLWCIRPAFCTCWWTLGIIIEYCRRLFV